LTKETRNAFLVIETLPPVTREVAETATYELADLIKAYCGGTVSTAFLDEDQRTIRLM
jgi:DNA/RNA-binding domain of Phe-tRNA-synthetase-like protein